MAIAKNLVVMLPWCEIDIQHAFVPILQWYVESPLYKVKIFKVSYIHIQYFLSESFVWDMDHESQSLNFYQKRMIPV